MLKLTFRLTVHK
uniref:Uncharacterized protein n=1 Tax=Anguilla anguilla TaxID=7936 RepID=A0A0E9TBS0_ANGAN